MITRFYAQNLGIYEDISIELDPFTVLVGPNGSGKSTILRGLRALAMLTRMELYHTRSKRPFSLAPMTTVADLFRDNGAELVLGVDVASDDGKGSYTIGLGKNPISDELEIVRESVKWEDATGKVLDFDGETTDWEFSYKGARIPASLPRQSALPYLARRFYETDPHWQGRLKGLYDLQRLFSPFFVFRFSPGALSTPAEPQSQVSYDGAGLAAELDRLLGSKRDEFDAIESELQKQFPHVKKIKIDTIVTDSGKALKALRFETATGTAVPAELESDGVMLTLAYIWLAHAGTHACGVEEPEYTAYPSLIRQRLAQLRQLSDSGTQVLVTTHSPILLHAAGEASVVRIFERESQGGGPRIFTPSEPWTSDVVYRHLDWAVT